MIYINAVRCLLSPRIVPAGEGYVKIREQTQKHLDGYARDGLRTLCIAKRVMLVNDGTDVGRAGLCFWIYSS